MANWELTLVGKKPKLNNPILIEGLPGIGNVGKVAVDFIIEQLKAEKVYDIFSHTFPHSVFVNDQNLVELPMIEVYYKKMKGRDLLFLAGDVQPIDEVSSYQFSEKMLDMLVSFGGKEVITLGGIGLQAVPDKPKVYCTASSLDLIKKYKKGVVLSDKLYGVVGPIVGVSGLLVGLASKRKMDGITLLAETFGHPMYLGVNGAKKIVEILNTKLELSLDIEKLEDEVKEMETEMTKKLHDINKAKSATQKPTAGSGDVNYIG